MLIFCAYQEGSIPREDPNQAAHLQHMKLCFVEMLHCGIQHFFCAFSDYRGRPYCLLKRTHSPNDNPLIIITVVLH